MSDDGIKVVATNRRARFEYRIDETFEAGLVLTGTEVKSVRAGRVNLQDAYCAPKDGHLMLISAHISPFEHGNRFNHEPRRDRILLLNRREINKLRKGLEQKGYTIIPLKVYFKHGYAKVQIGLAKGKKLYDKRADIAERENKRRLDRIKKEYP